MHTDLHGSAARTVTIVKPVIDFEFIIHRKSWEFLSQYVTKSQDRHERMKSKIAEALFNALEASATLEREAKLQKEEADKIDKRKKQELEAKKDTENNIYERPQAKLLADSFLDATKDIFALSEVYETLQDEASKSFRMKLKLTINRRSGQITDSLKQIKDVAAELVQICFESRTISKSAFAYSLVLLSKKLLVKSSFT